MKLTDYLGDKPFWRVTVKLAVPVALQNVLTSSFQLVDTLMVSQLGDVTLSAVGMAAQWGWLCGLLGFGLCSGMSVFISQYWGVKDLKGIRRVMGIGPYALRQSQNASFTCVLERKKEADRISSLALQGCVPKGFLLTRCPAPPEKLRGDTAVRQHPHIFALEYYFL